MESAGITRSGLPAGWRLLVDARVLDIEVAVIGSGVRRSKLLLPGHLAGELPAAEGIDGLAGGHRGTLSRCVDCSQRCHCSPCSPPAAATTTTTGRPAPP